MLLHCRSELVTQLWPQPRTRSSTASRTCWPSPPPPTSSSRKPRWSRSSLRIRASLPPSLPLPPRPPPHLLLLPRPRRRRRKSPKRRTTTWALVSSTKTCVSVYRFSLAVVIYCIKNIICFIYAKFCETFALMNSSTSKLNGYLNPALTMIYLLSE